MIQISNTKYQYNALEHMKPKVKHMKSIKYINFTSIKTYQAKSCCPKKQQVKFPLNMVKVLAL